MESRYDPNRVEELWYSRWLEAGLFHSDPGRGGEPYVIVIPPPNITGILHMGHALNNTIQDILIRWRRMQGRNALWIPGTDHAGIATQNVVERALKREEGKTRDEVGREAFLARVWKWREKYGDTITRQLKRLGCSCDWSRERFTMDKAMSAAVAEVFVRLYNKGLIYRANYIINWCPRCRTALSDEESPHAEVAGKLYFIRYPVRNGPGKRSFVTVATTRPETLLGDTAIAVNPHDPRYQDLVSGTVVLPILGRSLAVIRDEFVDPAFGTGVVKVTPAHDPNDFEMARRHSLEMINVMNGDGTMNEAAGPYHGLDRFECRRRILRDLEAQGLLERVVDHKHAVGHCYRCHTMVEPRLSPQWFVRMKPLAEPAVAAVKDGRITFTPSRWTKVYLDWMGNIRDWCISRQIWWGHRIPVFTCLTCAHEWAQKDVPRLCPKCGAVEIRQDEDVLDTWFSSWLWPFTTLGWPEQNQDLACYYPTHDLVTASEIIFFWVARMIMAGFEFMGREPFRNVYIHGTVRDDTGRKMSKSLGNSIDPLEIVERYSADALRFSLMMITATGQDVYVSPEKFEIGRNFGTKLWNAARFLKMQTERDGGRGQRWHVPYERPRFAPELLAPDDCYLLERLGATIAACTENLEKYRFNDMAQSVYEFIWHQFCDWHVEFSKLVLYSEQSARRDEEFRLMHYVFACVLRLLHPVMPFLTEELWHVMGYAEWKPWIMTAPWPAPLSGSELEACGATSEVVAYVEGKHDLVRMGRLLRSDYGIPISKPVQYVIKPNSEKVEKQLAADQTSLRQLLNSATLMVAADFMPSRATPGAIASLGTIYMPLEGAVDRATELARLQGELAKVTEESARINAKLLDQNFVGKAPAEIVERQRARLAELVEKEEKLKTLLRTVEEM
ncbi:MAG: valine--tRNA ligase [Kiritimatiellia bacterium]